MSRLISLFLIADYWLDSPQFSMPSFSMMSPELFFWGRETKGKPTLLIIGKLPMQLENKRIERFQVAFRPLFRRAKIISKLS
jgi:hypothetical protein